MCKIKGGKVEAVTAAALSGEPLSVVCGAYLLVCAVALALVAVVLEIARHAPPTAATVRGLGVVAATLAALGAGLLGWGLRAALATLGHDRGRA